MDKLQVICSGTFYFETYSSERDGRPQNPQDMCLKCKVIKIFTIINKNKKV